VLSRCWLARARADWFGAPTLCSFFRSLDPMPRSRRIHAPLAALVALTILAACTDDRSGVTGLRPAAADASAMATLGPTAAVSLSTASAVLTQTGTTAWTLAKTGAVDATSKTVTWTITATKGATTAGQLVVSGLLAVTNTGTAGATIGNIVVTLQQKTGSNWTSLSADVADATHGDAATSPPSIPRRARRTWRPSRRTRPRARSSSSTRTRTRSSPSRRSRRSRPTRRSRSSSARGSTTRSSTSRPEPRCGPRSS